MVSPHTSCDSREDFSYCIEGWIRDQQKQTEPEFDTKSRCALARHEMSDQPLTPQLSERPSSPSKRQRTSEAGSGSQWVERLSSVGLDSALPTFTEPTSSGTSASRAPSPTKSVRNRRIQLDYTSPAIYFGPPKISHDSEEESSDNDSGSGGAERAAPTLPQVQRLSLDNITPASHTDDQQGIPPAISALVRRLSEETADPALPSDIILQVSRISPTESFRKPLPDTRPSSKSLRRHLRHISRLFEMARELYAGSYDESAWYPLIRDILIHPPHATSATPFVKHEEAHTRQVCTELLPQQKDGRVPTVKVDHLLQFNPSHKQISPLYRAVFRSQPPSFSLSAFNDPVAAKTFTCAVIEVKPPGGNFQEASYQIAIASAAVLERIRTLGGDADGPPVVGWIVHGHFWTLHVSYREGDGSIRVLGPYPSGNTATYLGLYRLLRIIEEVKTWGRDVYFPYLSSMLAQFVGL
ncbi:hypothetical protein OIDMADRAFT_61858 [Oidiodendron maius Zn]|uniref:PD-(D/E)XK nuclease-like domain-containing protein n=1 Tax=Oidiodendron maius (strain Zn) TaxID=913774 RepID=A0A0C3GP92_OIDMZ|nr:hypothetical protein OIDMADRAFT_61858 [Oidiodendron maius Zn]